MSKLVGSERSDERHAHREARRCGVRPAQPRARHDHAGSRGMRLEQGAGGEAAGTDADATLWPDAHKYGIELNSVALEAYRRTRSPSTCAALVGTRSSTSVPSPGALEHDQPATDDAGAFRACHAGRNGPRSSSSPALPESMPVPSSRYRPTATVEGRTALQRRSVSRGHAGRHCGSPRPQCCKPRRGQWDAGLARRRPR